MQRDMMCGLQWKGEVFSRDESKNYYFDQSDINWVQHVDNFFLGFLLIDILWDIGINQDESEAWREQASG